MERKYGQCTPAPTKLCQVQDISSDFRTVSIMFNYLRWQNDAPQRCPFPNPQNLWTCYLTWQRNSEVVVTVKDLGVEWLSWSIPPVQYMSSVATWILKSNKIFQAAENQRYSSMRRTPSGIADFEDARRQLSTKQHGQPIEAGKGKKKKGLYPRASRKVCSPVF